MTVIFHVSIYILEIKQSNLNDVYHDNNENTVKNLLLDTLVFIQRKENMHEMCKTYASLHRNVFDDTNDLDHILVDEKHKLLYCYVPKVACTNWKRVFMILLGSANNENASSIPAEIVHRKSTFPKLSDYSTEKTKYFLTNFTKYIFVRHPFERLLSAYRNKLQEPSERSKYFQMRIGKDIIKRYRTNATNHSLEYGNDVTFEEFATYLIDHYVPTFNEHWKPISELCYPCLVKYDFIGKYETLQSDAEFLLHAINESRIKFPRVRASNSTSQIISYYSSLSPQIIARLYNIFILDFKLFSYSTENILGYEIG
ncbi:hypothetical protein PGB90_000674 [Kerria lacca]